MNKAILVVDMPDSCMGCNFLYCDGDTNLDSCQAKEKARPFDLESEDKPCWCPLLPIKESNSLISEINDCNFESRINDVIPMLRDEYHLYGTASLIDQLHFCLLLVLDELKKYESSDKE